MYRGGELRRVGRVRVVTDAMADESARSRRAGSADLIEAVAVREADGSIVRRIQGKNRDLANARAQNRLSSLRVCLLYTSRCV